jgi:sialate O-acetylesterase
VTGRWCASLPLGLRRDIRIVEDDLDDSGKRGRRRAVVRRARSGFRAAMLHAVNSHRSFAALLLRAALAGVLLTVSAPAEVKLAAIFGDGMVLQREMPVKVWGSAAPGEKVRVAIAGKNGTAVAGADGRWLVELEPQKAGGPHEMRVGGANELCLRDIFFGEVWLCAGQSNMQVALANASDGQREIGKLSKLDLRFFQVDQKPSMQRAPDVEGHWSACRAEDAARLSAVGYFFINDLHSALKVPVGLIQAVVGGTPAETWTDAELMAADPALSPSLQRAARQPKSKPGALFNGMIAPLAPLALRGVIWYQGESNTGFAQQYRLLFPLLIQSWRKAWAREDLPFLFVQLPGFGPPVKEPGASSWAEIREVQAQTLALAATGMAVAIDVGDVSLHPPRKREIGERLARIARARVYGDTQVVDRGPSFAGLAIEGGSAIVRFHHVEGGLEAPKGGKPTGFAIAGQDQRFVWAEARIEGDKVIVESAAVPAPVAVRYGWADNPACNLYNGEGLPAAPFRTDEW